nr:LysR substrate-binding domain-containing protein [Pseudomonas helmanticensis]
MLPLALFPQGCLYRQRAIRLLDVAQRPWRVAFGSHSLAGIQAAVASGLGGSVLPASAVLPEHQVCTDLPELAPTELALVSREWVAAGVSGVFAWGVGCGCRGICLTSSASVTGVY